MEVVSIRLFQNILLQRQLEYSEVDDLLNVSEEVKLPSYELDEQGLNVISCQPRRLERQP